MKKLVVFNVGGALSAYGEFNENKILIDLGSSTDFSPVDNFLLPLSKLGKFAVGREDFNRGKYILTQLFLSHLDSDHISDYEKFRAVFHPEYMTCPSDNTKQDNTFRINRDKLGVSNEIRSVVLSDMALRTTDKINNFNMSSMNPLVSTVPEVSLYYIKPTVCERDETLLGNYANNISLVLFVQVENKTVLFPGDILTEGMDYLISDRLDFNQLLTSIGIDYLVAPHHGLVTAFSETLFHTINGERTRLNIISEKIREEDSQENRTQVDSRYYSSEYSSGNNTLRQNAVKTSMGHIIIDFDMDETVVKQVVDVDSVIREFIEQ